MMTKEFVQWFVDYAGQNYGYNIETATKWLLTPEELNYLAKEVYKKYGIDDLLLSSHFCSTCQGHDAERPYHLDAEWILDLTKKEQRDKLNRTSWTDEAIEKELEKKRTIDERLNGVKKDEHAEGRRDAYAFYNLFWRVVEGMEQNYNFMLVQKDFFQMMYALKEEKINTFLDEWIARIDVVDTVDGEIPYQLYEM